MRVVVGGPWAQSFEERVGQVLTIYEAPGSSPSKGLCADDEPVPMSNTC